MKKDDALKKVDEGLAELNDALAAGGSERFKQYLEVMSRFHRYSFGNVMLILAQFPDATKVAGFNKWKEMGRYVKKGEAGIGILAPLRYKAKDEDGEEQQLLRGFKIVHVFDVSQTEGKDLPELASVSGNAGDNVARIEKLIRDHDIEVVCESLPMGALGSSSGGKITVIPGLNDVERFAILVHEFSHEILHKGARREETTKKVRETEAEAIAFVVCSALGLDSCERSSDYIALYRGSTETLSESLEFIQKTAAWGARNICFHAACLARLSKSTCCSKPVAVEPNVEVADSHCVGFTPADQTAALQSIER
jgi:antirestriction protein ArdC